MVVGEVQRGNNVVVWSAVVGCTSIGDRRSALIVLVSNGAEPHSLVPHKSGAAVAVVQVVTESNHATRAGIGSTDSTHTVAGSPRDGLDGLRAPRAAHDLYGCTALLMTALHGVSRGGTE